MHVIFSHLAEPPKRIVLARHPSPDTRDFRPLCPAVKGTESLDEPRAPQTAALLPDVSLVAGVNPLDPRWPVTHTEDTLQSTINKGSPMHTRLLTFSLAPWFCVGPGGRAMRDEP